MPNDPQRPRNERQPAAETAPLEATSRAWLAVQAIADNASPIRIDRALRIGRTPDCDITLDDDSVSRLHAVIEPGPPPLVRDSGSRNGTSVAGERLAAGGSATLEAGTLIEIGALRLFVDWERERRQPGAGAAVDPGVGLPDGGPMVEIFALADRLASDDITVLFTGETGVGKEVIARYLHACSPRAAAPFVPVHAAALSASLFESELFGHERGAFTGATGDRAGLFEAADGGSLFFDEIGELPLDMQPKLLRVLEDRRVTRVGGRTSKAVDVRILAATNRDLAADAASGSFRSDLYFRLSGFSLTIPPLRERQGEIASLARTLMATAARDRGRPAPELDPGAIDRLRLHDWPGNVRELKSALTRALLFAEKGAKMIDAAVIERALAQGAPTPRGTVATAVADSDDPERDRIVAALARHAGNQAAAAADLGIARRTLLYKLDRLGIPRPRKAEKTTSAGKKR